jgi:hypothetical protein
LTLNVRILPAWVYVVSRTVRTVGDVPYAIKKSAGGTPPTPVTSIVTTILLAVAETNAGTVGAILGNRLPPPPAGSVWNCVEGDADVPNAFVATLWTK